MLPENQNFINLEKSCLCDTWDSAYMVTHNLGFIADQRGCMLHAGCWICMSTFSESLC